MAKGEGKGRGGCGAVASLMSVLESITAIGFLGNLGLYLVDETYNGRLYQCLLDGYDGRTSSSVCNYAWALAVFSMLASFVVFLLMCLTCCCGKVPGVINVIFQ
eukprot:CAMPEP_0182441662 /NCGR_PEP_ID=MMETSP1172-20130603/653_1 /TAXON_ID=708627 /ORGANISM="Timspurckia oligopyrenoides, Strain CCMP3278" /LENGTH=103 /DNA_ID=CAMNT_0024636105 /DNA_START=48 /DNA_END=356 /DNA_ORIENTATION=+